MLSIHSLISPKCIFKNPPVKNKGQVLELLVDALAAEDEQIDKELLHKSILEREEVSVTSIGLSCALPHALTDAVTKTAMAVAIIPSGLDYASPDRQPVQIILMMVGPKSGSQTHLKLLSKIARLLHSDEFRSRMINTPDAETLLEIIKQREE